MPPVERRAASYLSVADLAPLRRMLGPHSMVIRVDANGDLMPFEMLPELFLGRAIRQALLPKFRAELETSCRRAVAELHPQTFAPAGFSDGGAEIMITPVLDEQGLRCQYLICWARPDADASVPGGVSNLRWSDLDLDDVSVLYRVRKPGQIEAAPWWDIGVTCVSLVAEHHQVSSFGLGEEVIAKVVFDSTAALAGHDGIGLRIEVPSADMLAGLLRVIAGALRASTVAAERIELGVPVELAVDPDLLPLIAHLRALGLQVDIVGLEHLTAKLHAFSDTSSSREPARGSFNDTSSSREPARGASVSVPGDWFPLAVDAVREAAA